MSSLWLKVKTTGRGYVNVSNESSNTAHFPSGECSVWIYLKPRCWWRPPVQWCAPSASSPAGTSSSPPLLAEPAPPGTMWRSKRQRLWHDSFSQGPYWKSKLPTALVHSSNFNCFSVINRFPTLSLASFRLKHFTSIRKMKSIHRVSDRNGSDPIWFVALLKG